MSNKRGEFYFPLKREQLLDESTDDRFVLDNDIIIDEETDDSIQNYLEDLSTQLERNINELYEPKNYSYVYRILSCYNKSSQNLKKKIMDFFSKYSSNSFENFLKYLVKKSIIFFFKF